MSNKWDDFSLTALSPLLMRYDVAMKVDMNVFAEVRSETTAKIQFAFVNAIMADFDDEEE